MAAKFVLKVFLLLTLVASVQMVILFSPFSRTVLRHNYFDAWGPKHRHLVGPGHDRLILAGGSNVAFGVDSSVVQAEMNRETINLGLHGDLGLAFMLHEVEDGARVGDQVILFPEYEHFFGDVMDGGLVAADLIQYHPSALRYFSSWQQWRNLLKQAVVTNSTVSLALLDEAKGSLLRYRSQRREEKPQMPSVYRSDAFDEYGDMVAHLDLESKTSHVVADAERIKGDLNEGAIRAIERCSKILAKRGAEFLVIYPSVANSYWEINRDLVERVEARLPKQLTPTSPREWVLADELFYDSVYHLNREGRALRTKRLVGVLRDAAIRRLSSDMRGRP